MTKSVLAVAAVLLTASTITLADGAIVADTSVDTLGLPSSALLLTEEESNETRGQRWKLYKQAIAAYEELDAVEDCDQYPVNGVNLYSCIEAASDIEITKAKWQRAKAKDLNEETGGTDHTIYWRARSY